MMRRKTIPTKNSMDQPKLNYELKFKLILELKNQLIWVLNEFTSLLYGNKNKEKLIEKTNDLLSNLVNLPFKIDHIENETNLTNDDLLKATLVIDSKMKKEIIDALDKNKYYYILFKEIDKDVKSNLIEENNNFVNKLMQFPVQMLKADNAIDNSINNPIDNSINNPIDNSLSNVNEIDNNLSKVNEIDNNIFGASDSSIQLIGKRQRKRAKGYILSSSEESVEKEQVRPVQRWRPRSCFA